ncbi:arsenate reductase ArsC [Pseudoclavibacter endophyticus]|uniref:Arsenate reductase ArsC n=1 Tax=Pseudoclavibacter endophyticus TaxID=1778590 RepID=A0A6H9WQD1_9MICO|nr:arsenate reductase ArsC [Pseudoclavibacter endophyticus]KAB1650348.1 arsenate reductase ArsC [Pseudoclavibacter endophyticus]
MTTSRDETDRTQASADAAAGDATDATTASASPAVPTVLFVCVHNAGRSQMAAGWLQSLAGDRVEVMSAGSAPKEQVNPVAVEAMAEVGVDIAGNAPKVLTVDAVRESDVVITMGCGDACPIFPGKRYEDWDLQDPSGQGIDTVRIIRDEIRGRVEQLLDEIAPVEADAGVGRD